MLMRENLMIKRELYEKVYDILEKVTPLQSDCGALCGKACCHSPDEDAGMYLFPGEEAMYSEVPPWLKIELSDFTYGNNKSVLIAICTDRCQRELRPLACRIFPLTPYMAHNGVMSIKIDPRAVPMCPLAKQFASDTLDENFVDAVVRAFRLLSKEKEIQSFVLGISRLIDEQERLLNLFISNHRGKKQRGAIRRKK
jgi:hypothetical protein